MRSGRAARGGSPAAASIGACSRAAPSAIAPNAATASTTAVVRRSSLGGLSRSNGIVSDPLGEKPAGSGEIAPIQFSVHGEKMILFVARLEIVQHEMHDGDHKHRQGRHDDR